MFTKIIHRIQFAVRDMKPIFSIFFNFDGFEVGNLMYFLRTAKNIGILQSKAWLSMSSKCSWKWTRSCVNQSRARRKRSENCKFFTNLKNIILREASMPGWRKEFNEFSLVVIIKFTIIFGINTFLTISVRMVILLWFLFSK